FVRFFDKGVSIVNPTGAAVTVTDGDLASLDGYRGPYYRFRGGQDGEFNNGEKFDLIELWGGYHYRPKGDILLGDGIILLDHQRTVVSEIIIDNNNMDSSAGSDPAVYTDGWKETAEGDLYWNQKIRTDRGWYPHIYIAGGDGSQTATFTPNIGVPGKYEVFEWHGSVNHGQMARRVPHKIIHAGGSTTKYVDQRANQGRMNSLGLYTFAKGKKGKVIISNETNGMVIADMILFKYRGEDGNVDTVDTQAPTAPKGVAVEKR
ncbi:hypothetical protein MJD09_07480, partial [bacterium]|nr:hypothetical protein [bacterium]